MRIYSMTATFGKLDHETLVLEPGLNILEAPNEWGKSTWCAFLTAMLYGLDTRAKTTKLALADKEHYAPWSGKPMSGRMDLNWNGRDITIERTTKGRVPMGEFRAYETETGLEIPELNGSNCGQMLLEMERSVFLRSGFIRLSDLPVSDDENLRRRLNGLVTTGDESGRGERLTLGLKELKNRIRYNRAGLLPQAEGERDRLEGMLQELEQLQIQMEQTRERAEQVREWKLLLENHQTALRYENAQKNESYIHQAEHQLEAARMRLADLEDRCAMYPDRNTAEEVLEEIERLHRQLLDMEMELAALLDPEESEEFSGIFGKMLPEDAVASATADRNLHWKLSERRYGVLVAGLLLAGLGAAGVYWYRIPGLLAVGFGVLLMLADGIVNLRHRNRKRKLEQYYGDQIADRWVFRAQRYAAARYAYEKEIRDNKKRRGELHSMLEDLQANVQEATEGRGLDTCRDEWLAVMSDWNQYEAAQKEYQQAQSHYQSLKAMAQPVVEPKFLDRMDYSAEDTEKMLAECMAESQRLENRMGQLQGRMDALGAPGELAGKLETTNLQIRELEKTYTALTLAQETLREASAQLQRRFAPRIAARAQSLMETLTGGRYDRLNLRDDLSLRAGTDREDILRDVLWRSDGTVDQLYLSLRLAVAGELSPHAPLILDDALARFDDTRTKAALEILLEEAEHKQVILFTCHSREKKLLSRKQ